MGYTHYWNVRRDAPPELVGEATREMARVVRASRVPLAGWDGAGAPVVTESEVRFNGRGPKDDHETFSWPPNLADPQEFLAALGGPRDSVFTFCKTARKPYDTVVVACLLAADRVLGDYIEVSTDASDPQEFAGHDISPSWAQVNEMLGHPTDAAEESAAELYQRVFGEEPDVQAIFRQGEEMTERRRSEVPQTALGFNGARFPIFEEATSPLYRSNDGRLAIESEPNVNYGRVVVDMTDRHVELFTLRQEIADAFVAGYDYHERVSRDGTA